MNNNSQNEEQNVTVKVSEILKKLKTYQDRKNFALENSKTKYLYNRLVFAEGGRI